jgi:DNA-binding beta-propeller fold protein YncE
LRAEVNCCLFYFSNAIIPMALVFSLLRIAGLAGSMLLAACSVMPDQSAKVFKGPLVWPQPPDQPRFVYETVLRAPVDIAVPELPKDKFLREMSGAPAISAKPVFDKPAAIVARKGRIYVADTSTESIVVFDVPRRKIFRFGQRQPNVLTKPSGLALDAEMNVYVADAKRRQVMVFDGLGLFKHVIGGPADLERPTGVAVSPDGERIYVIDRSDNESDSHKVVIYGKDGTKIRVVGTRGNGEGQFNVPLQATVAPDGTLYVLDSGNFRVQAFDREGAFLRAFGGPGINPGNFARPRGIAVDAAGDIYVTDASFNNFQIFQPDGQLLLAIGQAGSESSPGKYGLLNGIAVDETGRVYVADQLFNKVEVFRCLNEQEGQKMLQSFQN